MERFLSQFGEVDLTDEREQHIFTFHPEARKHKTHFAKTLAEPDAVRRSKHDPRVFILYRAVGKASLAIVVKTNQRNFILTAYLTDKIQPKPL